MDPNDDIEDIGTIAGFPNYTTDTLIAQFEGEDDKDLSGTAFFVE